MKNDSIYDMDSRTYMQDPSKGSEYYINMGMHAINFRRSDLRSEELLQSVN